MIVVKVELHSAVTGSISEIATMKICNVGGTSQKGEYSVETTFMPPLASERGQIKRAGIVHNYSRLKLPIWSLIFRALKAVGFDGRA